MAKVTMMITIVESRNRHAPGLAKNGWMSREPNPRVMNHTSEAAIMPTPNVHLRSPWLLATEPMRTIVSR